MLDKIKTFFLKYGKFILGLIGALLLIRRFFKRDSDDFNHEVGVLQGKSESTSERINELKEEIKTIKPKELKNDEIEDYWNDTLK